MGRPRGHWVEVEEERATNIYEARLAWRGMETGEGRRCAGTKQIKARGEKVKKGIHGGCC